MNGVLSYLKTGTAVAGGAALCSGLWAVKRARDWELKTNYPQQNSQQKI